ncbi:zinc protease [Spirochaetia bacterium]|nr:zinc protease [Spirochaetia bacterium]
MFSSIIQNPLRLLRRKVFFSAAALVFLGLFLAFPGHASGIRAELYGGLGKAADPVPFLAGARRGKLPSGLSYYIFENAKPENRAYLTMAVNAGSVLEEDDERGLAHFVEHMAFNGTTRFPEAELVNYLRSLGMRFGPEVNAYTSYDETVYGIEVPTELGEGGKKSIPTQALAVIDDWTRAIVFNPKDVDDERAVIMEEYRSRLGAGERFQRILTGALFRGSPYAERRPIGLPEIIENAPAERLKNFYNKWYRADNMALVLVGDFDAAAMEADMVSHFSIAAPDTPLNRPRYDLPPPQKGNFEVIPFTDPEMPASVAYLYYKRTPKAPAADLRSFRRGLIDTLIGRMLDMRFEDAMADPAAPFVYAGSGNVRYGASSRYYVLLAQAKAGGMEASIHSLLREKEALIRYGFTAGELELASRSLLSDIEQTVSEKDRQSSGNYVNEFSSHFLKGGILTDPEWELEAVKKLLPGIDLKEIAYTVKDYFAADDLQVFMAAPETEKENLPRADSILKIIAALKREDIAPPEETDLEGELVEALPQAGTIVAEEPDISTGAIRWELSNGAKVILKETKNQNNEIVLYAMARGGSASSPEEKDISANLSAEFFNYSGAGPYNRTGLMRKLADKQVYLSFWNTHYIRGFQGSSTTADIKTLFELLFLKFTDPRIDGDAAAALLDQYKTSLAQRVDDPNAVFSDELTRILYDNNIRFKPLEVSDLPRVNLDEALDFLKWSLNPADYTFVFTGNLDIKILRGLTETYLASLPSGERRLNAWTDPQIKRPGKMEKNIYKGKEARSIVYQSWFSQSPPFSEAVSAAAQALEEYLDIKLTEEIREKLGGVYSISQAAYSSSVPRDELGLSIQFICDPGRSAALGAAVEEELKKVALGNIDADVFTKAREAMIKSLEDNMQRNMYIAQSYANSSVMLDTALDRLNKRQDVFRALKPEDIQNLMIQLQNGGPAQVILYPEEQQ